MIRITNQAEDYLRAKNRKDITIEYPNYRFCCAFNVPIPEIFAKKPPEMMLFKYKSVTIDGFDIYINKHVIWPEANRVEIGLESVLGIKRLTLSGWSVKEAMGS